MKIFPLSKLFIIVAVSFLGACSGGGWKTSYSDVVDTTAAKGWRVAAVEVSVPKTLTVSEANSYAPDADIVWRGDAYNYGNRHQQVDAIVTKAARIGAAGLKGKRRVKLVITVVEFHALTERARANLQRSGVHNIAFQAQIVDLNTGAALTEPDLIQADLPAYSGETARKAIALGQTQKVRITNHIAKVIAGWLGTGPDVRNDFERLGR